MSMQSDASIPQPAEYLVRWRSNVGNYVVWTLIGNTWCYPTFVTPEYLRRLLRYNSVTFQQR